MTSLWTCSGASWRGVRVSSTNHDIFFLNAMLQRRFEGAILIGSQRRIKNPVPCMPLTCWLDTGAEDLCPAAYLACGKIAPEHEGLELNVGGSIISAAIREATGVTRARLSAMYNELGDPGDVAEACRHTQARPCLCPSACLVDSTCASLLVHYCFASK
jgi:hypothetical protein